MLDNPLLIARHFRHSTYDVIQGARSVRQVAYDGTMTAQGFGFQPANPLHPVVRREYAKIAEELGEYYGKYKSLAGINWLCGEMALGEPSIFIGGFNVPAADKKRQHDVFFKYSYDDETMEQFEKWARVKLPGKVGEPDRFRKRHDWIMANAKEKFIDFRCWATAEFHKQMKDAFVKKAPGRTFYALPGYTLAMCNEMVGTPLEFVRRCCFDPKYYKNVPGLVCRPVAPNIDGSQHAKHAHGMMRQEWLGQLVRFARDEDYAKACDTGVQCGRTITRGFFETRIILNPDPARSWVFKGEKLSGGAKPGQLAHMTFPQPGGRNWMADFVLLFRHSTPNFITYMSCDGSIPFGHFDEMQEFAKAYRQLPMAVYKTVKVDAGVYVRASGKAFYVVETNGHKAQCKVRADLLRGSWRDAVTSGVLEKASAGTFEIGMKPYGFRVFLPSTTGR